jgi:hypothetical protein
MNKILGGNTIEFGVDDWGGNCSKANIPGKQFFINGSPYTFYGAHGGETWDKRPMLVLQFRAESAGGQLHTAHVHNCAAALEERSCQFEWADHTESARCACGPTLDETNLPLNGTVFVVHQGVC